MSPYVAFVPNALYDDPAKRRIVAHEPVFTRQSTACGLMSARMTFTSRAIAERFAEPCKSCQRAVGSRR